MNPPAKPRFSRQVALTVAHEICSILRPACERMIVAGSIRRGKQWVGDVEIIFIPKEETGPKPGDFFASQTVNHAEAAIDKMLADGLISKRPSVTGGTAWGQKNKLALHAASGIPVDLFATTEINWFNYLVCRTGSSAHNVQIATRAKQLGWAWNPYGAGFVNTDGSASHEVTSEEDLFTFLRMEFKAPKDR